MKSFAAVSIFFVGLIIGSIPLFFSSSKKLKALLEYCEALTTGLFLGVGLTHLLPEAVAKYLEQSPPGSQPTAIFAICAGTAIVLQIMESTGRKIARKNNEHAHWLSYFLIMVLSVHSILEGLVLGFEMNPKYEMTIFIAIIAHKGAESFLLVTNILASNMSRIKAIIGLVLFSLTTPIGVIIGENMVTAQLPGTHNFIQPYFDSMAAGTFIYIAITNNPYSSRFNAILAFIGFCTIAFISSIINA